MLALNAAFWAVSLVLIGSGAVKINEPEPFARFVSDSTGWTRTTGLARALALAEVAFGLIALVIGGRLVAGLVAGTYLLFSAVVLIAIVREAPSCGCFGAMSSKPKPAHLAMNVASCAVATAASVASSPGIADGLSGRGPGAVGVVVVVLVASAAVIVVDTR